MTQAARPSSDVSNTGWTAVGGVGAALWDKIDESVLDTADYANAPFSTAAFSVGLTSVADPGVDTGHVIHVVIVCSVSGADSFIVTLKCAGTTIAAPAIAPPGTFINTATDVTYTLSPAEAALITDYSSLTLDCDLSNNISVSTAKVYQLFLEVPGVFPQITTQPQDQARPLGATASFSITATGATSYQWQKSDYPGGAFSDIGGATSSTYTTGAITSLDQHDQYRCNATNAEGTTTSVAATLTISQHDIYLRPV